MSERTQNIRVMIVDDHTVVRRGLIALLSASKYGIEVVGEAGDGQAALDRAQELAPDVILMDLFMPGITGTEATRRIRAAEPRIQILMLTSSGDEAQVVEALKAGASGYLLKDTSPDELVNAIHSVHLGQLALPQELAQKVILAQTENPQKAETNLLTRREQDVLECIARGMSNKQIARELSISNSTARTHVSSLLRKLNLESRTQLALYARNHKP